MLTIIKVCVIKLIVGMALCLLKSESQDQIRLQWQSGKSAIMNILVVHAMIILLTYGKPEGNTLAVHTMIILLTYGKPEGNILLFMP